MRSPYPRCAMRVLLSLLLTWKCSDLTDPEDGSLVFGYGLAGFHSITVSADELTITTHDIAGEELHTFVKAWVDAPDCAADPSDWRCKTPIPPATPGGSGGYGPA